MEDDGKGGNGAAPSSPDQNRSTTVPITNGDQPVIEEGPPFVVTKMSSRKQLRLNYQSD